MQQFLKIVNLLMFLGIFLIPKNFNAASLLKDDCCSSSTAQHCGGESGKENDPCHSSKEQSGDKDCHDCNSCVSIGFFAALEKVDLSEETINLPKSLQKISTYLRPEFLDFASKIWQPPKII